MMAMSVTMHTIWQSGGAILAATVVIALLLQLLVHRFLPAGLRREHAMLGAAIDTTQAVLLTFVATTAWEQYSATEALARHEADSIGNIYSVSHNLPEPAGAAMRADLVAYLADIIEVEWPAQIGGHTVPAVARFWYTSIARCWQRPPAVRRSRTLKAS